METAKLDEAQGFTRTAVSESDQIEGHSPTTNDIDLERLLYDPEYRQAVRGALRLGG
jgi:hypothetical protein